MSNLFGGSLSIKDGFSTTFGKFAKSLKTTNNSFKQFTININNSEKMNRVATKRMEKQIQELAKQYVEQGYTMAQAIKKASSEIQRVAPNMGNSWVNAFGRIKQVGIDSFGSIQHKVSKFANSTLGTITKLSAGFVSLKTVMKGLHTGFDTGMEYQNLRVMMNSIYGNDNLAEQKFTMASNYAQATMFSETEVVDALSTMKGIGLGDDEETLSMMGDLGSFAKSKNRGSITEAVEAYADMMNGEWERMQTILNIKRVDLEAFVSKNRLKAFSNKKGEIIDKGALVEAFKGLFKSRGLEGLTEKMGETATGQLERTISNIKKSLSDLVGITNTGEVRDGSLFQKFIEGLEKLNTKVTTFSNSGKFDKIADKLSQLGDAIYSAFSYIIENPELITSLLKFSVAIWGLGKIGDVANSANNIYKVLKALWPYVVPLATVLSPLVPYVAALVGTFMVAKSIFAEGGVLNRGLSFFLGKIPFVGTYLQEGFNNWTRLVREFFTDIADWIKQKLGFGKSSDTLEDNEYNRKWYPEKFGGTVKYHTISDMEQSGSIAKVDNAGMVNNNTNINFNIDTVRETADVDELMETAIKRLNKYQNTRNTLY